VGMLGGKDYFNGGEKESALEGPHFGKGRGQELGNRSDKTTRRNFYDDQSNIVIQGQDRKNPGKINLYWGSQMVIVLLPLGGAGHIARSTRRDEVGHTSEWVLRSGGGVAGVNKKIMVMWGW